MDDDKLRQQAWDFFQMQAGQRLTTFNFYIAISSLLSTGLAASLKTGFDLPYLGFTLGVLLMLFSFIFWKLDQRNYNLIKSAERTLIYFESKSSFADENGVPHVAKRFTREKHDTDIRKGNRTLLFWRNHYSYYDCLRAVFIIFGLVGLAGLIWFLIRILNTNDVNPLQL